MVKMKMNICVCKVVNTVLSLLAVTMVLLLSGCGGRANDDLVQYIEETKRRPAGSIEPLPSFRPYEAFSYSASTERSPFDPPVKALDIYYGSGNSDIKPDLTRRKEYLEEFPIESLKMVGTLEQKGQLWALIDDRRGGIHRVQKGNYLGKDHGKIVATSPGQLTVVEIVSDGVDGWIERPRTIELSVQE
ncbi:pilus assembly protein PilP [Halioxenophilus sp. WMMB6]|uniref:pilus assembly protein PilP n=1 Tax=Halioxenophilus sp. WMMB6 TaxID=3073815 RepID=UPI00295E973E|nr:pilus assembly protein PilP [Halioxenophilus sp. WMMB6]